MGNSLNSANSQTKSLVSLLNVAKWKTLRESEIGYIFSDEYLASSWDDVYVQPESLPKGKAEKKMRKVTSPVLLLKSHSPKMAFILATESSPVYFCSLSARDKNSGYTMLFDFLPEVSPEYFFYLSKYKSWTKISYRLDSAHKYGWGAGFSEVGCGYIVDVEQEVIVDAESVFLSGDAFCDYCIPSLSMQLQQIKDAKMLEQVIFAKMSEKERKFQQKEWLNETHIRNSKHRLSNNIMPVRMAIERLADYFEKSTDGVKLSSIIGEATQQTVSDMLTNLRVLIKNIEEEISNLTKSETVGEQLEILDVEPFIREFCDKLAKKFGQTFVVDIESKDKGLKIKISRKSFMELLDNIVSNAVRHGFTDNRRKDYRILITLSKTDKDYCRIDIANNGNPISERGRKEYFVRGSFAGETGNTGIGGARVFEICDEFNGEAIEPYATEDFPVVVSVKFPIVLV